MTTVDGTELRDMRPFVVDGSAQVVVQHSVAGPGVDHLRQLVARGDLDQAWHQAAAVLAGEAGPEGDVALPGALAVLALVAWDEGRVADALGLSRAAVARGDSGSPESRRAYPRLGLSAQLAALGCLPEAAALIDVAAEQVAQAGDRAWAPAPRLARAQLQLAAGDLAGADAEASAALDAVVGGGAGVLAPGARTVLAATALLRGDVASAGAHLPAEHAGPAAVWVAARLADATGDRPRALALVAPLFDTLAARRRLLVDEPAAAAWLTRLALAVNGDGQAQAQARAAAVVTCAEQLAAANPGFPTLAASAAHARGLLDQDPVLVARAAAGHRHLWARASAWEDLGLLLADRGERANARRALDEARRTYGELGAAADAARVDGRLEGMRARRPRRPVMGWGSLTDTERRVAHVVAQGLTNAQAAERLFLSRHTVDFHLRQIFQKLAIGSRVELTRIVLGRHPVCDR